MTSNEHNDTGRIDRNELLARVNLTDVLDALTPGRGVGHQRRWQCPDSGHPDVHPSVTMSRDRHGVERWRCWSGGHSGTAIDALIAARQLTVGESIRWLNDHHAHLAPVPREPPPEHQRKIGRPSPDVVEYVEQCEHLLWTRSGTEIRTWLNRRGLTNDVLIANRVGADPGRRSLPRGSGLPTGRPAAVYPALDQDANITYFQARFIDQAKSGQKYGNPVRRLATNPRLAWTQPVEPPSTNGPLIVTEGIPDALIAAAAGIQSVGILGTTAPSRHVAEQLSQSVAHRRDCGSSIVICFDADQPGRSAAARLAGLLHECETDRVSIIEPPDGMDITDWAATEADWTRKLTGVPAERRHRDLSHTSPSTEADIDFGP